MILIKDPFHIQWHITNLCNLRCKHCYQDDFSKSSDLDWEGLKKVSNNILTTIGEWGKTACIHLTGGEPLLKPELFSLLNNLDQQPLVNELGIITNGLFIDQELVRRFSAFSKLRKIKVSLDGVNKKTNDSIRSTGIFNKVMENLSLIKAEGRFETILMFTIMKRNFRDLLSLISLCQNLGINGLIIERFIPWGRGRNYIDQVLDKKEWKELIEIFKNFFLIEEVDSFSSYQAFQINFNSEEPELMGAPCVIGVDGLCIMPGGDVFPCRRFPISIGNLLNDSLNQIWENSEILKRIRKKENLKGKCGRCEIKDCIGCRSLALSLTGDYLAEDPHCWYGF